MKFNYSYTNWQLKYVIIIAFNANLVSTIAQVQTTLRPPPSNQLVATDLLQLSLNNPSPVGYTIFITGKVSDVNGAEVLQFRSMPIQLNPGLHILREDIVTISQIIYSNTQAGEMLQATGQLPTGIYKACVSIFDYQNNNEIGTTCLDQRINEFLSPNLKTPMMKKPFQKPIMSLQPAIMKHSIQSKAK